jgi:ferrous iron transport protein A
MTLKDCEIGKNYIVEKSMLKQPSKRRLEALGLIEGTIVRKINQALDGSVIFVVRGTRLAIGKDLAEDIIVRKTNASDIIKKKKCLGNRKRDVRQCRKRGKGN